MNHTHVRSWLDLRTGGWGRKYKEANPPRSSRSKHPSGIPRRAHNATRQETKRGRDKETKKKENIWIK